MPLRRHRVAVKLSKCIAGFEGPKKIYRIQKFVKTALSEFDQLTAQLKHNARLQISFCEAHPDHLVRRLILLAEAVRRVLQSVEGDLVSKVEQFYSRSSKVLRGRRPILPSTPSAWQNGPSRKKNIKDEF